MVFHLNDFGPDGRAEIAQTDGGVFQHVGLEDEIAAEQGIVLGRRDVALFDPAVGRREAVGRAEGAVRHAELARLGVHLGDEGVDGAGGGTGQGVGGIVGRLDHHGVDQLLDGEFLVLLQPDLGATHLGVRRDGLDDGVEGEGAFGEVVVQHGEGHQLGHARGRAGVVRVVFEKHVAGGGIEDDGALVAAGDGGRLGGTRWRGLLGGGRPGGRGD